jgi:hypothetical protein
MRLKPPAAAADGATPTPTGEKPTVYRALSSLVSGGLMVAFGLLLASTMAFGSDKHPIGTALGVLLFAAGLVGGLYPAAKSHADRLEIVNPFRRIVVPWPRVEEVSARLSLVVLTKPEPGAEAGHKFTVWAVPVSMHDRRKADRTLAKQTQEARRAAMQEAKSMRNTEALLRGGRGAGPMRFHPGVAPIDAMAFADQAVSEMNDRKRICDTRESEAPATAVSWTWWSLALFGAAALLLVLAAVGVF